MSDPCSVGIHLTYSHDAQEPQNSTVLRDSSFATDGARILGSYEYALESKGMTKEVKKPEEATVQIHVNEDGKAVLGVGQNSLRVNNILGIAPNNFIGIVKIALALKKIILPPEITPWVKPEHMIGANLLVTIMGNSYFIKPSGEFWGNEKKGLASETRDAKKLKTPLHALLPGFLKDNLKIGTDGTENMKVVENDGQPFLECVTWKGQTIRVAKDGKIYLVEGQDVRRISGFKEEGNLIMPDTLIGRVNFPYQHASCVTMGRGDENSPTGISLWLYPQGKVEISRMRISSTGRMPCSPDQIQFFTSFPTVEELESTSDDALKKLVKEFLALGGKK